MSSRIPFAFLLALAFGCGDDDSSADAGVDASVDAVVDASSSDASDSGPDAGPALAWNVMPEPADGPLLVWAALVVDVGPTSAVLFGGTNATDIAGDTLDRAYLYGWEGEELTVRELSSAVMRPGPRYCGCAAYDATRNVVIVAGGRDLEGPFLEADETWELDLATETWTRWSGTTPASTLGCMMTADSDGALYWFGGASPSGSTNTLYRAEDQSWIEVTVSGERPPVRYDGALWADADGLLLFGGSQSAFGSAFYADVWRFDGTWTRLDEGVLADGTPVAGRRVPWFRPTPDGFVIAGGFDMNMNPMGGLFRWTLSGGFEAMRIEEPLEPRGFAASLPAPSGIGVMLSGYDGDGPVREALWLR